MSALLAGLPLDVAGMTAGSPRRAEVALAGQALALARGQYLA